MILIADSGSTKTHWCLLDGAISKGEYFTEGINPYYQEESEIRALVAEELLPQLPAGKVESLYFYGAGCANEKKKELVYSALASNYPDADIQVESDLLGACRSLLQRTAGVACILGTGSNSCCYDGEQIHEHVSPLGFILGDEGSGAHLGKQLVADVLKKQLPPELCDAFFEECGVTEAEIVEKVYRAPFPNRFLASLSPFLKNHLAHQVCSDLVYRSFVAFFERNILQYEVCKSVEIQFVGSVAYHYRDLLDIASQSFDLKLGAVESSPMKGLVTYHSTI